jgi:hypothetical protein
VEFSSKPHKNMRKLMFLAVMSLVGTGVFAEGKPVVEKSIYENPGTISCTVTVQPGPKKKSVTVTISCSNCTQQEACDAAYSAALIASGLINGTR